MNGAPAVEEKKIVRLPNAIVIKDLAILLRLPVNRIIAELMKNGVMSSMNERVDFDTAAIIAEDLGFQVERKEEDESEKLQTASEELMQHLRDDDPTRQQTRPPVVVIMGHVDHGKTRLLDTIRETNVVAGESGGITQHIGAYQVEVPAQREPKTRPEGGIPRDARDDRFRHTRTITFIDTPGHEAFSAMRSRGAQVADIAVLVVAADDGLKPQTMEAIKIIQQAKLPFLVAINKVDKPAANIERVKQQLAEQNLLPEDWGGKIPAVPVSAQTGSGIDDLLETVLLVADIEPERLRADPQRNAVGAVIEAHIDRGEGPVATVLVRSGTLHRGDFVRIGAVAGRVKALKDWRGNDLVSAGPSQPAKLLGLKASPTVGDILVAVTADEAKKLRREQKPLTERATTQQVFQTKKDTQPPVSAGGQRKLNIVLRADNLGSEEAIVESLHKFESPYVAVEVVAKGLGSMTDADVLRADTAKALLLGFHVVPTPRAVEVAKSKQLAIRTYTVIYDLLNDVKRALETLLPQEIVETVLGHLRVLAVFRQDRKGTIIGGRMTDGALSKGSRLRILREGVRVAEATIVQLQQEKKPVEEVKSGEAGIRLEGEVAAAVGDTVEAFRTEERKMTLSVP